MSTKPKPKGTKTKSLEQDLATFEELPEQTKELMKLKQQDEKATGPEQVVTTGKIHDKAREMEE